MATFRGCFIEGLQAKKGGKRAVILVGFAVPRPLAPPVQPYYLPKIPCSLALSVSCSFCFNFDLRTACRSGRTFGSLKLPLISTGMSASVNCASAEPWAEGGDFRMVATR